MCRQPFCDRRARIEDPLYLALPVLSDHGLRPVNDEHAALGPVMLGVANSGRESERDNTDAIDPISGPPRVYCRQPMDPLTADHASEYRGPGECSR
jgi:hypothetical protein